MKTNSGVFDGMDIQWFGDKVPGESLLGDGDIPIRDDEEEKIEYQVVDDESELEPEPRKEEEDEGEIVKLTKEQLEALQNNQSVNQTMVRTLGQISEAINKKAPAEDQLPTQKPGESNEDFEKRFNEEVFKDNPAHAVREMIERVVNPYLGQFGAITAKQAKSLMEVHPEKGENFRRYKGDIDKFVEGLPPQQRNNPGIWEYAYNEVMKNKQPEIVEDMVERKVRERLKEMGVSEPERGNGKARTPQHMEGVSQGSKPRTRVVRLTRDQEQDRLDSGMTREDYVKFVLKKEI